MPKKKKSSRSVRVSVPSKFARVLACSSGSGSQDERTSVPVIDGSFSPSVVAADSPNPVEMKSELTPSPGVSLGSPIFTSVSIPQVPADLVEAKGKSAQLPESKDCMSSASCLVSEISSTVAPSNASPIDVHNSSSSLPLLAETIPSSIDLPWASKFKASLRNLKQMDPPSFLEDGTPVVVAPPSVLLKSAAMWKGHIVAQFHGLCPPPGKIFTDLNPIWGKFGNITVRIFSDTAALIYIPSPNTRQWVVDIGFWQAGNCSCTCYHWSPDGPLEIKELQTAPTWAILRNVPPQLYSLEGISVIASGIGEPLHTEKSWLDPVNIGFTKVKVVINLESTLPSTVVVRDVQGNIAKVKVEYPRPPPKCLNCGRYGHLLSRCPKPLQKKLPYKKVKPAGSKEINHPTISLNPSQRTVGNLGVDEGSKGEAASSKTKRRRSRSKKRSSSLPPKLIGPLLDPKAKNSSGTATGAKLKWVAKSDIKPTSHIQSSSKPIPVEGLKLVVQNQMPVEKVESKAEIDKVQVPAFPFPPDWDSLSNKSKKKQLKIWHNRVRSANLIAQTAVRDEVPIEPSLI
ncbi:uncharacterized protein LOC110228574 [Arabidopsis lyrata subsp. lyrata]|uniref:uncharacterized protein LOC110227154 n=1 Tax=Arabidopsis lyrata subsp. lyrata TaxID=81972 RepID=UPI000A29BB3E|nr:uncharacterized protein LOC110227154 [Arabidopsis lyrata subsp. lyrata]XP_020881921.1 uncharacterized protein LOC110228574 [Arabidopsis lyrata subsp. lyrata]|eukprot:XP_020876173.1 uncharacterized protein LOC110227154 [Arabidopsis lyrata subsp. lyrata]